MTLSKARRTVPCARCGAVHLAPRWHSPRSLAHALCVPCEEAYFAWADAALVGTTVPEFVAATRPRA